MKVYILTLLCWCINGQAIPYTTIGIKILEAYISEILDSTNSETECSEQLRLYVADVKIAKTWALGMLDSTAKLPPGILTGNKMVIGNYDECLEIDVKRNTSHIRGQYCRSIVSPTEAVNECIYEKFRKVKAVGLGKTTLKELEMFLHGFWDVCVPAACSAAEIQDIWNFAEERYDLKFRLSFDDNSCNTLEKQNHYSPVQLLAVAIFSTIGAIVLMSTLYDIFVFQRKKEKQYNVFMAFSYYTNGKRMLSIKDADDTKITCLHGIRVFSIIWVILGHRIMINFLGNTINFTHLAKWLRNDENMFLTGGFSAVDTFFVISGFLIIYLILLAKENGIQVNLIVFYIHRILRLTPSLAALILVYVGIVPHLGMGPYWNFVNYLMVQPCKDHWWETLTFTQNYVHPYISCVVQTWYLSVDTHLYVLSPLIFLPLQRWPKPTIAAIVGLILASTAFAMEATYRYQINTSSVGVAIKYFKYIYNPTHIRMSPWLLGILLGYYMFKTKDVKIIIKRIYVYLLWIVCIGLMLVVLYLSFAFMNMKFTLLESALFNGLIRLIWGACICWVIFACARGYGGYINKFLSLSIFNVLARLTFSMFLTHGLVIGIVQGQRRTTPFLHNLFEFYEIWGDIAFTVSLSFIWTLTFESPVTILESVFLKKAIDKNKQPEENFISQKL